MLEGPTDLVKNLHRSLKNDERFCDAVIPQGEPTDWGTKWDVMDSEVISASWLDEVTGYKERERSSFTFKCWTPWSPPVPVWNALYKLGFNVSADYFDECDNFEGHYYNGVDGMVMEAGANT
jgi:hypothetical protein